MAEPAADDLARLYALPLGDFVAARDARAKELKAAGSKEEAAAVKALVKPSASAWALTRLFAEEPRALRELVAAGEAARAGAAAGASGAAQVRSALATAVRLIGELHGTARALLTAAEQSVASTVLERVGASLQALAFDPATAPVAARGWLDRDLEPPGFELLAALQIAAEADGGRDAPGGKSAKPARASAPAAAPAASGKDGEAARRSAAAARREAERREAERLAAERRAARERLERELRRVTAERARAGERRAAAEAQTADLERRLEVSRREAKTAASQETAAAAEVERLQGELAALGDAP